MVPHAVWDVHLDEPRQKTTPNPVSSEWIASDEIFLENGESSSMLQAMLQSFWMNLSNASFDLVT